MTYTKGPWTWRGDERQIDEFTSLQSETGDYILWPDYRSGEYGMSISPYIECTQTANARLIASAPELLEALEEARAALHQHYVDWDGEPEDAVPLQLARSKCEAAIAKARGAAS